MALFAIANEYNLGPLKTLAEASCIRSLTTDNLKEILKSSHVHQSETLKQACFDFVKVHAPSVLTNPSMMALMKEDPALWAELTQAVVPESDKKRKSKKRARKN